jgi:hypothetical protein
MQRIETSADWNPRPATTARDITLESDVRQVLRAMTPAQRLEALNSAIRNNDTAILAAAFSGPSLLIAMPAEERSALLGHWRRQHVPAWSRHERLKKATARIDQAGRAAIAWMRELSAATDLQELADKAEAARSAAEAMAKGKSDA